MMKIENMCYIVEVSKCKFINKARQNLFVNQRQLDHFITLIEEELNMKSLSRYRVGVMSEGREIVKKSELL